MHKNDVTRLTTLWTQSQNSVLAFILSTITDYADAEDVLQSVATVVVGKFEQFDPEGDSNAFTAWSISIARYEVLRYLRDRATDRHELISQSLGVVVQAFEDVAPERDERRSALSACLRKLAGRPREVLEKRYGDGMKTGAIAAAMGLSPGNVSVILNRTYRALRDCIDTRLATVRP